VFFCVADEGNRCFFNGEVGWEDEDVDFAVVQFNTWDQLNEVWVFVDSIHVDSPGYYIHPSQQPWWSNYYVEELDPWQVYCWLVEHGGSTVPLPQHHSWIFFPDDFTYRDGCWYCSSSFSW
jgi:hypothetical protein